MRRALKIRGVRGIREGEGGRAGFSRAQFHYGLPRERSESALTPSVAERRGRVEVSCMARERDDQYSDVRTRHFERLEEGDHPGNITACMCSARCRGCSLRRHYPYNLFPTHRSPTSRTSLSSIAFSILGRKLPRLPSPLSLSLTVPLLRTRALSRGFKRCGRASKASSEGGGGGSRKNASLAALRGQTVTCRVIEEAVFFSPLFYR